MRQLLLILTHHVEAVAEVSETSAQVHLVLELFEDFCVVEVGVRKQAVETSHDVVQVLLAINWDRDSVEV